MVLIKDNFKLTGGLRAYGVVAGILALCLLVGIANFALADAAVQPGSGIVDLLALLAMVLGAVGLAFLGTYSLYLLAKHKPVPSHICFSQNGIELDGETLRFDEVKRIKMTDPHLSGMRVLPQERFMWMRLQDGSRKLSLGSELAMTQDEYLDAYQYVKDRCERFSITFEEVDRHSLMAR